MSKNILNQTKRKVKSDNVKESTIKIINNEDNLIIDVNKEWAKKQSVYDLSKSIVLSLSPLFLNDNSQPNTNTHHIVKTNGFKHVAFFIENVSHYTGGRYSLFHQAVILSNFTKVSVYMNSKPPFFDDFREYMTDNFFFYSTKNYGLNAESNDFDLVIGTPPNAGEYAVEYAKRFNIPVYLMIFESPNWISTMRDGIDADEEFWKGYKKALQVCDKVIVPSQESRKWVSKWLDMEKKFEVIKPCINDVVAEKIKAKNLKLFSEVNNKVNVVFASRMAQFKNPLPIIKKLSKEKFAFHIIGKIWSENKEPIEKLKKDGYEIDVYESVNDAKKFEIIGRSDVMIHPSHFEGFGMSPMEALFMGKPVIAYDLPVLNQLYGLYDGVQLIPVGDIDLFVSALNNFKEQKIELYPDFAKTRQCASRLMDVCGIPKLSVGTIVYNGEDYLEYAIKSVYPYAWEHIIVDGKVEGYGKEKEIINSTDDTEKIISRLIINDKLKKINYIKAKDIGFEVRDKIHLQNLIAENVLGHYYLKLDHDEIWKKETLLKAIQYMEENKEISYLKMSFLHFWLSFKKIAMDNNGKWSTKHPRIWRWNTNYRHYHSFNYFEDGKGNKVAEPFHKAETITGHFIYHFGWVRRYEKLMEKIEYYKNRGIENFVKDTVTNWEKDEDDTQPTQDTNSYATDFIGELPAVMKDHPYAELDDIRKIDEKSKKVTTDSLGSFIGK